jgi:hypothetical protein
MKPRSFFSKLHLHLSEFMAVHLTSSGDLWCFSSLLRGVLNEAGVSAISRRLHIIRNPVEGNSAHEDAVIKNRVGSSSHVR